MLRRHQDIGKQICTYLALIELFEALTATSFDKYAGSVKVWAAR
jgi:hypothetical protein